MPNAAPVHLFVRIEAGQAGETLAAALRACATASRKEEGCVEYRIFADAEKTALFLKETWASQEALDIHQRTPHFLALRNALETHAPGGFPDCLDIRQVQPLDQDQGA